MTAAIVRRVSGRAGEGTTHGDWLAPRAEQRGLQRYLTTLRDRWWIVLLVVVLSTGTAVAYVKTASKVYEASADLLVTPVSSSDPATLGLGLIQDSNDPTRDVSTATRFIVTTNVARRVVRSLHLSSTPGAVLASVNAQPVAQSSIVTVTAQRPSAKEAADVANSFAVEAVADRTEQLRRQLDRAIPALRQRLAGLSPAERQAAGELETRLGALEALRGVPDPTISLTQRAELPTGPSSPRPKLAIAAGLLAGLILGLGGAFLIQAIDPRLRTEDQLRSIYRVPILARIPLESRRRKRGTLAPSEISGAGLEAYRTLRATLAASHSAEFRSRSVLITGSSPSEGKSTTAINFAVSLMQAGNRVILIEADMHRPTIGKTLGVRPRHGIGSVLIRQVALQEALITTEEFGPDLQLLLVDRPGLESADRLSLPTARQLVSEAEALADFVVVDSPPLTEVIDALPLVQEVGDILVVVRLGKSKLRKLTDLGEILAQYDLQPSGVALIGVDRPRGGGYYYAARDEQGSPELEPSQA